MNPAIRNTLSGVLTGAVAGLLIGLLGELAVFTTARLFPTDVLIVGFAVYGAVLSGTVVGAVCGWRGWFVDRSQRGLVCAAPGVLFSVAAVFMQWSAV